jgi:AcrR family transcriptional regulator
MGNPELHAIEPIHDGVFFTVPETLPRGRHKLTLEQVRGAQSERLLAASTELLAALGYRRFGAGDVARRAGVSLTAFYGCFADKDQCLYAAYDRFIAVLLGRMTALELSGLDRNELVHSLVSSYLGTLQADLVVARAFQVEIDALGRPARERRRNSLAQFASFIRQRIEPDQNTVLPWSAYLGVVYAARQLASDALETTPSPDLLALSTDIEQWLVDLYRKR